MYSNKFNLISPSAWNGMLKQCFTVLIFVLLFGVVSGQTANPLKGTAEAQTLLQEFPFPGKTFNNRKSLGNSAGGACKIGIRPDAQHGTR